MRGRGPELASVGPIGLYDRAHRRDLRVTTTILARPARAVTAPAQWLPMNFDPLRLSLSC